MLEHRITGSRRRALSIGSVLLLAVAGCSQSRDDGDDDSGSVVVGKTTVESCMSCHNGAAHNDYSGPGLENPHPFPGAGTLRCTECHGGDPQGADHLASHVPPPPEIGDEENQTRNRTAYFNRLTLTGIDKFPDYTVNGRTYSALDYLQFINPGDLRVASAGRSCGSCHAAHTECVAKSPLATEVGVLSGATYAAGIANQVPESVGLYERTAGDLAFRETRELDFAFDANFVGAVSRLEEFPVFSVFGRQGANDIFRNAAYNSRDLPLGQNADGSLIAGSPIANLYHEQVAFTCGNCHLGSAGANNRYGDFRSSGCTSCHMRYSLDGRSRSSDPNINKLEPADPDDIEAPERPHVARHRLVSVARTLTTGEQAQGIDDYACAGCHQGSNRTVMQYWGIRLDQNQDLRRRVQYPANPVRFTNTARDTRLFDPEVGNRTFNGRNANQYILSEDYDGDGRDDTPEDVHYEAGLGCIDCHGSHDVHGGRVGEEADMPIMTRQEQAVSIRCESCHGTIESYAATTSGVTYDGRLATLAVDVEGTALRHVERESDGRYFLTSRLTGRRHYVPQTRDTVSNNGRTHPDTGGLIFNAKASYAMGRVDADASNGTGPLQAGGTTNGFSHLDNVSCVGCHASWTNTCVGCHLEGEYNTGNNFSNITGDRIVFRERNADFVYQSPVPFQLGVNAHGKIAPMIPNTEAFFRYRDQNQEFSQVFSFSDRNGAGSNDAGRGRNPSLSHNALMPHSIRGRVSSDKEGPRYCVACHLTNEGLANHGAEYATFRDAMRRSDFAALDYDLLREHFGRNPGNQLNSPLWVHMVAGLGSGLFLFDASGAPINPLDTDRDRKGAGGVAPAERFLTDGFTRVRFDTDRIVEESGVSNGSNNHAFLTPGGGAALRDGALDPGLSGPLGRTLIERLVDPATGVVLDSWIDADGQLQGQAATFVAP